MNCESCIELVKLVALEEQNADLQAEVKRLIPYETAVKKRHNGYSTTEIDEPSSPEQALQELWDERDGMEDVYVKKIADLQAENKRLEGEIKKLKKDMKDAGLLTEKEFNKWFAVRIVKRHMAEQALKDTANTHINCKSMKK